MRFTEDRPTLWTPSPFAGAAPRSRSSLGRWLAREDRPLEWFTNALAPALAAKLAGKDRKACQEWYEKVKAHLAPGAKGKLGIDEHARALGVDYAADDFLPRMIEALESPETRPSALSLLKLYGPTNGPGDEAGAAEWRRWHSENRPYLFYSEWGGYRWYVDPLARRRGVPTAELRGPKRADLE